jgi:hypothetical protein
MHASLGLVSVLGGCEPVGGAEECGARTISGAFPGLGRVNGAYSFLVDHGGQAIKTQSQTFTVTGGTGMYAGASGSGTLERILGGDTDSGRHGFETWTGTLNVPGLDFDVVAPVFVGAVKKAVKAKRGAKSVRVSYQVTATDAREGPVPARCKPASGSRFPLGRTRVTCETSDSSANAATASFSVLVKPTR